MFLKKDNVISLFISCIISQHMSSPPSSFCTKIFRKYQLYIANVVPWPQRLKDKIWEAKHWEILNKLLPQVMVNPENFQE